MKLKRFSNLHSMNLYTKLLASLCLVLSSTLSYSQDSTAKKYPSLLWEITGNNLSKPSYLFGTMHVSSKLVFHLSDSFFMALHDVDAVALESKPDEWLTEIAATMSAGGYSSRYANYDLYNQGLGLDEYSVDKGKIKGVFESLSTDMNLINAFLYRSNGMRNQDFEERTYLDMFIYQSGMKLNKKLMSLEEYEKSTKLVNKAYSMNYDYYSDYDVYEPRTASKFKFNNYGSYGEEDPMETAYRNGDLDMLDSLELAGMTAHQYKYMLTERNLLMADRADSIMNHNTLFIAVGAGHLAGEQGMIELLRSKGYKLRPVMQKGRDDKARRKLEKIQVKIETVPFISSDSFITADFPGNHIEYAENGSGVIMSPDLVNGAHYTIHRHAYHSVLFNETPDYVLERIDSFLYENVRGDIISKKKIEVQGFPGYNIINKTRSGTYERSQLIVFPDEIILVKLGGTEKYVKGKQGKAFFKSLEFRERNNRPKEINVEGSNILVEFPQKPWGSFGSAYGTTKMYIASNAATDNVYLIENFPVYENDFLPDTAKLRFALTSFKYTDDYEFVSGKYLPLLGRTALEWELKNKSGKQITARAYWASKSIVVQAVVKNQETPDIERFFASVKPAAQKPKEFQLIHDSVVFSSYMALDTPIISNSTYAQTNFAIWGIPSYRVNYVYNQNKSEFLTISTSFPGRYADPFDSTYFISPENELMYSLDTTDRIVIYSEVRTQGEYKIRDRFIGDTACSLWNFTRDYWSPLKSHYVTFMIDSSAGSSEFFEKFLETFEPWDTNLYDNPYKNGLKTLWEDLSSSDTIKTIRAMSALSYFDLDDSLAYKLVQILDTCDASRNYRVKLRRKLANMSDTAVLHYFHNKFKEVGDTTSMQMAALRTIIDQRDTQSLSIAKRLLLKNTPLYSDEMNETYLFSGLYDSLELAQRFLPEILELTEYKEYESQVYGLLAKLADSGFINPKKNKFKMDRIIREANNELKRANSSGGSGNAYYGSYYSGNDEKSISYNLKNLLHVLYPFRKTNDEVAEIFAKAKKQDIVDLKFELIKLQFAADSSIDGALAKEVAKSESNRFDLYMWMQSRKKLAEFPQAYLSNDSLIKPAIKYRLNGYSYDKDSIYILGQDELILKNDTGIVQYFRIHSKYGNSWQYGCVYLLAKDSVHFPMYLKVNAGLGVWKESDKWEEKRAKFSELISILQYEGIRPKNILNDFYLDEDMLGMSEMDYMDY